LRGWTCEVTEAELGHAADVPRGTSAWGLWVLAESAGRRLVAWPPMLAQHVGRPLTLPVRTIREDILVFRNAASSALLLLPPAALLADDDDAAGRAPHRHARRATFRRHETRLQASGVAGRRQRISPPKIEGRGSRATCMHHFGGGLRPQTAATGVTGKGGRCST